LQGPKQKYGLRIDYAKKALDLAIRTNKVEEFVSHLKTFIEVTKTNMFTQYIVQSTDQNNEDESRKVTETFNNNTITLQNSEKK
ncbi:45163_t:CDS:2, partial [Gigaspora margarita]